MITQVLQKIYLLSATTFVDYILKVSKCLFLLISMFLSKKRKQSAVVFPLINKENDTPKSSKLQGATNDSAEWQTVVSISPNTIDFK